MPLTAHSSDVLHKCHQIFPALVYDTLEINLPAEVWVIISTTTYCIHTVFSLTQQSLTSQLFLCAIKYLHCLSLNCCAFHCILCNSRTGQAQSVSSEECKELLYFSLIFFSKLNICWLFIVFLFFFWQLQGTRQSNCSCFDVPSSEVALMYLQVKLEIWRSNNPAVHTLADEGTDLC